MVWFVIGGMVAVGAMILLFPLLFGSKKSEFEDFESSGSQSAGNSFDDRYSSFGDSGMGGGKTISITQAQVGDHISLPPTGAMNDQIYFTINKKDHYKAEEVDWYEYTGTYRGTMVGIEVYSDDELEITLYQDYEKVRLADLDLTEEKLDEIARSQDESTCIVYDGKEFSFDWSGEIAFYENDGPEAEMLYCWDFREHRGNRILAVEKYDDEPYVVYLGYFVKPSSVKVHRD